MNVTVKDGIEYVTITRSGFEKDRELIQSLMEQNKDYVDDREFLLKLLETAVEFIGEFSPKVALEYTKGMIEVRNAFAERAAGIMAENELRAIEAQRMLKLLESRNAGDMSPFPQDRVQEE